MLHIFLVNKAKVFKATDDFSQTLITENAIILSYYNIFFLLVYYI